MRSCKLSDISTTLQTGPFGSQLHQADYTEVGIPVIMPKDIIDGIVTTDDIAHIPESFVKKLSRHKVGEGDILFSRRGEVSKTSLILPHQAGWLCGTGCLRASIDTDVAFPRYVFYFLQQPSSKSWLVQNAIGATMLNLNTTIIGNLPIDLPSLDEQKRIAEILTRYDDAIENCKRQIALLEEAAQRTYNEWFVDMRFPGHEQANFIDGLPEEWEHKRIGDVFSFVRGKSYTSKEINTDKGIYLINLKNINGFGGYKRGAEKLFDGTYKEVQCVEQGDVIMAVTDMTQERRLVGHVALVPKLPQKAIISMDLIKLIPFEISKIFLYYTLYYGGFGRIISPLANGVNVLHLRPESILSLEMIIPCNNIRNRFESIVNPLIQDIEVQYQKIDFLREARDILLPRLISGEITI